jgi:hypothetical protein
VAGATLGVGADDPHPAGDEDEVARAAAAAMRAAQVPWHAVRERQRQAGGLIDVDANAVRARLDGPGPRPAEAAPASEGVPKPLLRPPAPPIDD